MTRFATEVDRLVAAGADPFERDDDPTHITASGVVTGPRGVVLLRHRRLGIWLQPGGHVDRGEQPWEAARRETVEETGMTVRPVEVDGDGIPLIVHVDVHAGGRGHTHLDLRYHFTSDDEPNPGPGESQEIAWFDWDAAIERADPGLRGLLRRMGSDPGRSPGGDRVPDLAGAFADVLDPTGHLVDHVVLEVGGIVQQAGG